MQNCFLEIHILSPKYLFPLLSHRHIETIFLNKNYNIHYIKIINLEYLTLYNVLTFNHQNDE